MTAFGEITYRNANYFYIDDGSGVNDGLGHIGVKVSAAGLTVPIIGFVKATGISACETNAEYEPVRLLRARTQGDIKVYLSPSPPPPPT